MSGSSLSRRGLLLTGAALAAAGLSGCDLDRSSSQPGADTSADPDEAIVTSARDELAGLIAALRGGTGTTALIAVHRAQLEALQGVPPTPTAQVRPLTPQQTIARERRAAVRFTRWANTAESGDLARLLASIAAGIRVQPVLREAT